MTLGRLSQWRALESACSSLEIVQKKHHSNSTWLVDHPFLMLILVSQILCHHFLGMQSQNLLRSIKKHLELSHPQLELHMHVHGLNIQDHPSFFSNSKLLIETMFNSLYR